MSTPNKNLPTLDLNISEENEIGFKLRIEGSDKDLGSAKPHIRFVVTEANTGRGWIFSAAKTEDGVAVTIPIMKGVALEENKYQGKLEVILGGRYFTPTEVDIEFTEPLKVEAAVVSSVVQKKSGGSSLLGEAPAKQQEIIEESPELSIESEIDSIIVKESTSTTKQEPSKKQAPVAQTKPTLQQPTIIQPATTPKAVTTTTTNKVVYSSLLPEQKELVNQIFLKKCQEYNIDAREVRKLMKEGSSYTKKRLTALLAASTKEYADSIVK